MKETIYKEDAIDAIMSEPPEAHYPSWYAEQIKALPPAQPERASCKQVTGKLDLISRQDAIDALKICDNNEDGINCHKCPLRDERWDGAWQDDETNCYTKLMRDSAKLLELPSAQPKIIHCDDCVHYTGKNHSWGVCLIHRGVVTNRHRVCQGIDYCSWAERREE